MAGKRVASNYLTDQNWEDEEEGEDPGTFSQASKDVIKKREIKTARRRKTPADGETSTAFKGFSFGKGTLGASEAKLEPPKFSFGNLGSKSDSNGSSPPKMTFGNLAAKSDDKNGSKSVFGGSVADPSAELEKDSQVSKYSFGAPSSATTEDKSQGPLSPRSQQVKNRTKYLANLKALNEGFEKWVCSHLETNPLVDLSPVCSDYLQHMKSLEAKLGSGMAGSLSQAPAKATDAEKTSEKSDKKEDTPKASGFTFGAQKTIRDDSDKGSSPVKSVFGSKRGDSQSKEDSTSTPGFSFGAPKQAEKKDEKAAAKHAFSFGAQKKDAEESSEETKDDKPAFTGFTFGGFKKTEGAGGFIFGSKPAATGATADVTKPLFSFGGAPAAASTGGAGAAKEEEYVPPKSEHKEIEEEGAIYTKRCKLFYQKEGKWTERGLGNLFLKKTDADRTQMIVRADTALGNVLLNILLQSQMSFKAQQKGVTFVCVPNPGVDPKNPDEKSPTLMLVKVKTEDDAKELAGKLEENKG